MNIAIIHYHLNRGGVTQVILSHLQALDAVSLQFKIEQIVVCHGGRREGWPEDLPGQFHNFQLRECAIPGLEYDEGGDSLPQPQVLTEEIRESLTHYGCRADNTLLHVHNHALGKNLSIPGVVRALGEDGFPILAQLHDFVEDFRPANYRRLQDALSSQSPERLPELLYPQGSQIHYAVLNSRDAGLLQYAGITASRLHVLPNPIQPPEDIVERSVGRTRLAELFGIGRSVRYILYPTRGIRRKNLGEMLLWAAANSTEKAVFSSTLAPLNPIEQPRYAHWRALAHELKLPCVFESGRSGGLALAENVAACDRMLTTSLAEGFGLTFLESCLSERPLIGRDLPDITYDFAKHGITFAGLYPRLDVPIEWIGRDEVLNMFDCTFNSAMCAYRRQPLPRSVLAEELCARVRNGGIDFGDLDADLQESVLRSVCGNARRLHRLLDINPWLRSSVVEHDEAYAAEAHRNAVAVRCNYSLLGIGQQLATVYRAMTAEPPRHASGVLPNGERILDAFLNFSRFRPARL